MGLHTAIPLNRGVESAEGKTVHSGRLAIGPRLILGFVLIILSMLAADAIILWQFYVVRTQAARLSDIDRKLVAVLRVHAGLLAFHDQLEGLADAEDADRLLIEAEPLRSAVLEDIRRATNALTLSPSDPLRDPTILPTIRVIESALPSQLEAITTLAASGDWRAVHLRLSNQVRPLENLTSALVEKVEHEAGDQQAKAVQNIRRVRRVVFWVVPLTAVFTLLIAATLGMAITRSITQPLARLVEGSKALARGEFQHQVSVTGKDELAHLGHVFNDTATRLQDLYATLQQSEDRLSLVIDTIPAHVWSARSDGSIDSINQRLLEFFGRSMEDVLGWGWGSLVHPDDLARVVGEWQAAVATGEPMESEARLRRMDGNYRWLLIRNVPLRDKLGNIVSWYGTAIDIEERHRAEDALRRSENYLTEAQRLSHTGSWAGAPGMGEIRYWSEECHRVLGFDPQVGQPRIETFFQRIHPDDQARTVDQLESAGREKREFEFDYRIVHPGGGIRDIHTVGHPVFNPSGDLVEFVGTVMDITERKRAEEERERLRQVQADLAHLSRVTTMSELTVSLAHEIRQPISAALTNAKTCLRWLGRDDPDVAEGREAAARIVNDVTRAAEIISRISLLFKKTALQRELVDINEVIREMIVLLRSEANRYAISIRIELAEDLPKVMAERVQLQQVLMNLMLNGIDAMKGTTGDGALTIKSEADDGQVLVSVSDTGVGLLPEQAEQIFKAFFTTKDTGTGMGLPISRSIIESHGGRLWAAHAFGPGATFQFTLPSTGDQQNHGEDPSRLSDAESAS
jgi:PAS domain S-box-containing protein